MSPKISTESTLRIGVLMPEVLGTYGDGGNAVVLAHRAELRGVPTQIIHVGITEAIPADLDIYTLGGGEDIAQTIASRHLHGDRGLSRAIEAGAPVLAICAALQVLGSWYTDAQGNRVSGADLLDVVTLPQGARAIGELVTRPANLGPLSDSGLTQLLTGFENHGGATLLGAEAQPFGLVLSGTGNGLPGVPPAQLEGAAEETGVSKQVFSKEIPQGYRARQQGKAIEGAVQGSVIATYMHGPVLARNPQLADYLLSRVLGELEPLEPEIAGSDKLRSQRIRAAGVSE